jgi:hypothetical protein
LVAQNTVNTNAAASVHVGGQNFAPIKIIIDSITQIFNTGVASSNSGDATSGGARTSGSAPTGQTASSGSAQATGARIQNTIDLRSSAAVRVKGNNYNPIDIVLNLTANLFNTGVGVASTGDAQASGGGSGASGGAATSGAASATGLEVMNLVNMWGVASVDVEGNNYAPIVVQIHFKTNIDNRGMAVANSGNASAGQAGAKQPAVTQPAGGSAPAKGAASQGSSGTSSKARSGSALAVANSVDASITSNQLSGANAASTIAASAIPSMLRELPTGKWSPFVEQNLTTTVAPPVEAGLNSTSGDSTAVGLHSTINQTNSQLVACSDPNGCLARNAATMDVLVRDSDTNPAARDGDNKPGRGGTSAESGAALVNATPTPISQQPPRTGSNSGSNPDASRKQSTGGSSASARQQRSSGSGVYANHQLGGELAATGHVVIVDLWSEWPGRRLPPMPEPLGQGPSRTNVSVSMNTWPGSEELPLPTQLEQVAPATEAQGRRAAMSSDAVASDVTQGIGLLELTNVDPWDLWPTVDQLPVPAQVLHSASRSWEADAVAAGEPSVRDEAGVTLIEIGLAAIIATALGVLGGTRRGRGLVLGFGAHTLRLVTSLHWLRRLGRQSLSAQAARGLAFLRLTLGALRLW